MIVFLAVPGMKLLDLAGPLQVFSDAAAMYGGYETRVVSLVGGRVATDTAIPVDTEPAAVLAGVRLDTMIVVGGEGAVEAADDPATVDSVRVLAGRSRRTGSVCTGAFLLAAAGLLDNLQAVTHWDDCDDLARRFPKVSVCRDPIYIRQDDVWTSAGCTAGIDMALAMIADDLGRDAALAIARQLVAYLVRPGGQSQFSTALQFQIEDAAGRFETLHKWIAANPGEDLGVERLAAKAGMSPRNFSRVYKQKTGISPAKAVEHMRVENARMLLETTGLPVSVIAVRCGFGDDERLRRAMARTIGVSPVDYRRRFAHAGA